MTERQVQRAFLKLCGRLMPDVFITHVPNGAHLAGSKIARFKQMGALKGDGLKNGFPDLICLWSPRQGALIEAKREKGGRLSESQIELHAKLDAIGWPVCVMSDPVEGFRFLQSCGAPFTGEPSV